jgi:hypothetical protein
MKQPSVIAAQTAQGNRRRRLGSCRHMKESLVVEVLDPRGRTKQSPAPLPAPGTTLTPVPLQVVPLAQGRQGAHRLPARQRGAHLRLQRRGQRHHLLHPLSSCCSTRSPAPSSIQHHGQGGERHGELLSAFDGEAGFLTYSLESGGAPHGVQVLSLVMILVSCTGIFLPLEVALNQAWGVTKSRNYLFNQLVAFGLALLMVALALISILLNAFAQGLLTLSSFITPITSFTKGVSYVWLSFPPGSRRFCFFFSIYWILPNRKVPWRPVLRTSIVTGIVVAAGQARLCAGAAASRSEGALRAVLCVGGAALLGLCLGADSLRRGAVQRGALGR